MSIFELFILVCTVYKKRFWWKIVDQNEIESCDLLWSQTKNNARLQQLQSLQYQKNQSAKLLQNTKIDGEDDFYIQKLFNEIDYQNLKYYFKKFQEKEKQEQNIQRLFSDMSKNQFFKGQLQFLNKKSHNHLEKNFHLCNKKALFYNLRKYCENINDNPFNYIPVTFHITNGLNDTGFHQFLQYFKMKQKEVEDWDKLQENEKKQKIQPKNIFIIKPGEVTNRGNGIVVMSDLEEIKQLISKQEFHQNGHKQTYIIQQYIDRPLLYNKRKFDIRCYLLLTSQNGLLKGYIFQEGYIRTSSTIYTTNNLKNQMIHLTNDAVQKKSEQYGKFEGGNKISYKEFQKYIMQNYPNQDFDKNQQDIKKLAYIAICSVYQLIDPNKKDNSFEIFGLDFMIDEEFKTYLIEVNTNPCYETPSTLLSRLIPNMIDNALKIAVDSIFLPPLDLVKYQGSKKDYICDNTYVTNKFEMIFDELVDGNNIKKIKKNISESLNTQLYAQDIDVYLENQ